MKLACAFLAAAAALLLGAASPFYSRGAQLALVARFDDRQITGIAVAPSGRTFVNLPRWTVDVPVSVAEVVDGKLVAYPNDAWNAWRNAAPLDPKTHFVCVQSVVMDPSGNKVWVLDPGSPDMSGPVEGAPKLVSIDLATNRVDRIIPFDATVAPPGSYLNDVRFTPDGRFAIMSDSGIRGSLVVTDLATRVSRRILDGDPTTQFDRSVTVTVEGRPLRRPDGRGLNAAADGIALSSDGATFYWQALDGDTLYAVATNVLTAPGRSVTSADVRVVEKTHPADGLWMDPAGTLYVSNPTRRSIESGKPGQPLATLIADPRLHWPDSFAEGADGTIFFTTSHIEDSPWFDPSATTTPSEIWKITPAS